jgi:DNA-binding transcriptional regulator YiaG
MTDNTKNTRNDQDLLERFNSKLGQNRTIFHRDYNLDVIAEETGLSHEEFARRLNTTPQKLAGMVRNGYARPQNLNGMENGDDQEA